MQIVMTIMPIFIIIQLGWLARRSGLITPDFLNRANKLVFYYSIPALIFSAISKGSFHEQFNGSVLVITLLCAVCTYFAAFSLTRVLKMAPPRAGAFVMSAGHGNLGYVGLPVALYYLGTSGLRQASVICGFLMIMQNLLSIIFLQLAGSSNQRKLNWLDVCRRLIGNPVILGAMAGMAVSLMNIPIPRVIHLSLDILGGLAPPMALMLIGASMSLTTFRSTGARPSALRCSS